MKLINPILYFQDLLAFRKDRERFLVVEILKHCVKVSALNANFKDKKLFLAKFARKDIGFLESPAEISKKLKKLLFRFGKISRYKIVVSLDSRFAATIHAPVKLIRENPKTAINESELENLLSQAVWRFHDRNRNRVALKLNTNDLDVLLSDVHIKEIKLDGHKALNPIGFSAKSVEVCLGATFTERNFSETLNSLLPKENILFLGESGATLAYVLSQSREDSPFLLIKIYPQETTATCFKENSISNVGNFAWGTSNLEMAVAENLNVAKPVAAGILSKYLDGNTSAHFARRFEKLLFDEFGNFGGELANILKKTNNKNVYIYSIDPLPLSVCSSAAKHSFGRNLQLIFPREDFVADKLNFELKLKESRAFVGDFSGARRGAANFLLTASVALAHHFCFQNEQMNKIIKRRVRWLL